MSEAKTKAITIKFSQAEYDELLKKASSCNLALATYVRERILYDLPQIKHQSFEFKMLKAISFCVGNLLAFNKMKLTNPEREMVNNEILRVMKANGLDENTVIKSEAGSEGSMSSIKNPN